MSREPNAKVGLSLRFSEQFRARIEKESQASGLSMNDEVLKRLDESFQREDKAGSRANRAVGDAVMASLAISEERRKETWITNPETARYAFERAQMALADAMGVQPYLDRMNDPEERLNAEAWEIIAKLDATADDIALRPQSDIQFMRKWPQEVQHRVMDLLDKDLGNGIRHGRSALWNPADQNNARAKEPITVERKPMRTRKTS